MAVITHSSQCLAGGVGFWLATDKEESKSQKTNHFLILFSKAGCSPKRRKNQMHWKTPTHSKYHKDITLMNISGLDLPEYEWLCDSETKGKTMRKDTDFHADTVF